MPAIFLNQPNRLPPALAERARRNAQRFGDEKETRRIGAMLGAHEAFAPTPLISLDVAAAQLGVRKLWAKDERDRWSLGSFKALGGVYAVLLRAAETLTQHLGRSVEVVDILRGRTPPATQMTFAAATAGNHGRVVARGAQLAGARAVIFVPRGVPDARLAAIASHGAEIVEIAGNYETACNAAIARSNSEGWILVSDAARDGYEEIPTRVMQGYCVLAAEALAEIGEPPTHLFVQAGVGGLAAAMIAYFMANCAPPPRCIVVEAEATPCLLESARQLRPVTIESGSGTIMGRLECRVPSSLTWPLLTQLAHGFVTISDASALRASLDLAAEGLATSPSGAAGLAGLQAVLDDRDARGALHIDDASRILIVVTEAPETADFAKVAS